jgi:hypothetical protein
VAAGLRAALPLVPALFLIVSLHVFVKTDPDYWWHVRTGQYIYETGTLPRGDIYSYTVANQPWVTHEWLTELLFYQVQRQFGYVGNVVLFGVATALAWLTVYASCRRWGVGGLGATLLMLWGFIMAMGSVNVRPQALTTLLLAISVLLLTRYKQGHVRALWLMPPMFAVWVNLHGGYIIGLVLLGLTVVGEGLALACRRPAAPLRPLLAATVLSAAATLLNPHGVEALLYPFMYAGSENAMMRYILEWQSPDFHDAHKLFLASSILLTLALGLARRPLGVTEAFWALAFALLALQSLRHIPLYAVVTLPLLGARLQAELPAHVRSLVARHRSRLVVLVAGSLIGCCVALALMATQEGLVVQLGSEPSAATYPAGAVDYLRTHISEDNLFNDYYWGGYLIYQLYPERRVFIDGRSDVYAERLMDRYAAVQQLKPNWRQVLDEHNVRLALVKKDSPLDVVLGIDEGWQELYVGEVERLFARRAS